MLLPARRAVALQREGTGDPSDPITFSKQVAPILQAHCQTCHHTGDIAPFPLITYDDAFQHRYKQPIPLKARSRLDLAAYYDNSADNFDNPNSPPQDVGWGENTTDEMCIAFVHFTLDLENLTGQGAKKATTKDTFSPFWEADIAPGRQ